ncbi:amidohydrolase [Acidithrix sp. C25]|uniref:amidohydrolase n=1 Tax=Acidithrix sp. C25 TaxID=1671482 RepID=UPI00191BA47D|nr:amidohydrolase [Acidithrix sp. C25]
MSTQINGALDSTAAQIGDLLVELSHKIHANPEVAFEEFKASRWTADILSNANYDVAFGVAEMETAYVATIGNGDLEVAICAEYDALPDVGHACGHNIIAAAAIGAGLILAPLVEDLGLKLSVMGTPAEEGGGGKILMLNAGLFESIDLSMMVHPAPSEFDRMPCVAAQHLEVEFLGKESHAAAFPQLGINALDAMTISQVAIGLLRQSLYPGEMIHGFITHGGEAPNIIPARTAADYIARAETLNQLKTLVPRIRRCFEAGAIGTGSELKFIHKFEAYSEFITDETLAAIYRREAVASGRTISTSPTPAMRASTDMANVSMAIPSIHPILGIDSLPAVNHQPEFTAACITQSADKAVVQGALAMARTIAAVASDQTLRAEFINGKKRIALRQQMAS